MSDYLLEMQNIQKSFYGIPVLCGVNFGVKRGEVHVLLGENGAGKSTLMKILSGTYKADSGAILIDGQKVEINEPAHSIKLGIGMVYQELTIIPHLSVVENIYLGNLPSNRAGLIDWKKARENAKKSLQYLGLNIDISRSASSYDLGIQQLIEIVRIISKDVKLIILDEPTSSLTDTEIKSLFNAIRLMKNTGVSFIYITHKLAEVSEIGDRVTVLRDGSTIGETLDNPKSVTNDTLISMMVGRTLDELYPKVPAVRTSSILAVKKLSDDRYFHDISFDIRQGEVLGIAGLVGAGRSELAKAIFGLHRYTDGEIKLNEHPYVAKNPSKAIKNGIGLVTNSRKDGLMLHMPIYVNICVAQKTGLSRLGFRKKKVELDEAKKYIDLLKIDTDSALKRVRDLSGGNQQKVAIAKWNCNGTRLYIMDDPTRGIDVGAKVEVYKLISQITADGASVLLISSDLPELLNISDRIMVMRKGRVSGLFNTKDCTQEIILNHAIGSEAI